MLNKNNRINHSVNLKKCKTITLRRPQIQRWNKLCHQSSWSWKKLKKAKKKPSEGKRCWNERLITDLSEVSVEAFTKHSCSVVQRTLQSQHAQNFGPARCARGCASPLRTYPIVCILLFVFRQRHTILTASCDRIQCSSKLQKEKSISMSICWYFFSSDKILSVFPPKGETSIKVKWSEKCRCCFYGCRR